MVPIFRWIKKFFNNFICFITNHDFYVIPFCMHYMLFIIIIFRRKKKKLLYWIFHVPDFLRLFMVPFKYGVILLRYSSTNSILFFITFAFVFDTIITPKIIYSFWFIIIFSFFFILKKILNISMYYIFNSFNSFFSIKRFFIFLIVM